MEPSYEVAFSKRKDLEQYGDNAHLLFSLELRFRIDDIDTVAASALTDGTNDKKCDLIYFDEDTETLIIAQGYYSKSPGKKKEAPSNKASDLNTAIGWIFSSKKEDLPQQIAPASLEIRDLLQNDQIKSIEIWYTHNLTESKNVQAELKIVEQSLSSALKSKFKKSDVQNITAIEVGKNTLNKWYNALLNPIQVTDSFDIAINGGYQISAGDWEAFVTAIPAAWLYTAFNTHKSAIFSANVRGYLGSRRSSRNINHGIKVTAQKDSAHFWAYNNGITALVLDFNLDKAKKKLTITGLSIVNGAQTTGAIGSLENVPTAETMVQARFVKCKSDLTIQNIIKYNNSQNEIEASDFRSNDAIQKRIKQEFQAQYSSMQYTGARRGGHEDIAKRSSNFISADTVAQAIASFQLDPSTAYNNKSQIWISDGTYAKYFNDHTTASHIVFVLSLLRAIENHKLNLIEISSQSTLTDSQQTELSFLRQRGATFLLLSAISNCIESFLGKPVISKYKTHFKNTKLSLVGYRNKWEPIVEAVIPFCSQLEPAVKVGLKNADTVKTALNQFKTMVEATKKANASIYSSFSNNVEIP